MLFKAIFPFLLFAACTRTKTDPPPKNPDPSLQELLALYQSLSDPLRDPSGFIETDTCDSLLFSSLVSFHKSIDLWAAYDSSTGQWHRTPSKTCYSNQLANEAHADDPTWTPLTPSSKSTISRDMLLGVMWYSYIHGDLPLAQSIWDYGTAHDWIMGDGLRSRTQMSYSLLATLAQLIHELGGTDHQERHYPVIWLPGATDYEAHILVWHILLRIRLYDKIEDTALARLKEQASRQPENALFIYAAGDVAKATELLLDPRYFPVDRLPTAKDRCSHWLFERDRDSSSWDPCDSPTVHSGGEILSLGYLLTEGL